MDYKKIAEYQIELENLRAINSIGTSHEQNVTVRARMLELADLIYAERSKPTL